MLNLQVGTKLVVTKSNATNGPLQVGQEHVVDEVRGVGKYKTTEDTGGWYLSVVDGELRAGGLCVALEVVQDTPVEVVPEVVQDTTDYKRIALMQHLSCAYDEVENTYPSCYDAEAAEYLVLTDDEADEAFEEALDSVLDDVILPDLDEALQCYFDRKAWKRDASYDGRGHHLNHYDGCEEEVTVNGVDYYIYRTN